MSAKHKKIKVLDLFSGCGGLSFGFESVGFEIVAGIDNWDDALKTFQENHKNAKAFNLDLGNPDINKIKKDNI